VRVSGVEVEVQSFWVHVSGLDSCNEGVRQSDVGSRHVVVGFVDLDSGSVAFDGSNVFEGDVCGSVEIETRVHGFVGDQIGDLLVVVGVIVEHEW